MSDGVPSNLPPSALPTVYVRALEGLERGLLPVLLFNWSDEGECDNVEWHLFEVEKDGPAYDESDRLRERFAAGVAVAIRYYEVEHDCEDDE